MMESQPPSWNNSPSYNNEKNIQNDSHSIRIGVIDYTESMDNSVTNRSPLNESLLSPPPSHYSLRQPKRDLQQPSMGIIPKQYNYNNPPQQEPFSPSSPHQHVPGWGGSMTETPSSLASHNIDNNSNFDDVDAVDNPILLHPPPLGVHPPVVPHLLYATFTTASSMSGRIPSSNTSSLRQDYHGVSNQSNSSTIRHLELLANSNIQYSSSSTNNMNKISSSKSSSLSSTTAKTDIPLVVNKTQKENIKNILLQFLLNNPSANADNTIHNTQPLKQQQTSSLSSTAQSINSCKKEGSPRIKKKRSEPKTVDQYSSTTEEASPHGSSSYSSSQTTPPITNSSISRISYLRSEGKDTPPSLQNIAGLADNIDASVAIPPPTMKTNNTVLGKRSFDSLPSIPSSSSSSMLQQPPNNNNNNIPLVPPIITIPDPLPHFSYLQYAQSIPISQQILNQQKIRKVREQLHHLRRKTQPNYPEFPLIDTDRSDTEEET